MKIKTGSGESLTPIGGDRESPTLAWIRVLVCLAKIPSPRAGEGKIGTSLQSKRFFIIPYGDFLSRGHVTIPTSFNIGLKVVSSFSWLRVDSASPDGRMYCTYTCTVHIPGTYSASLIQYLGVCWTNSVQPAVHSSTGLGLEPVDLSNYMKTETWTNLQ